MKIAPPVMLAQLIKALYNIVDSYYVGTSSETGLTALSIIYPLQLLISALGDGTGVGVNTVMARMFGTRENEKAESIASIGTLLGLGTWAIFALVSYFLMPAFVSLSTDSPLVAEQAVIYGRIVCVFSFGIFLESIWTKVHQASGNMRSPMIAQITGAVVNIILDPILIFGLGPLPAYGIAGAAAATVIGQMAAALITFRGGFRPLRKTAQFGNFVYQIYRAGLPSILMQMLYTVYIVGLNMILSGFSDDAVTVLGLYYKLQCFFFIPLISLQTCIVPVLSYNYAIGAKDRCRKVLSCTMLFACSFMSVGIVGFVFFPVQLIQIFSKSAEVAAIGQIAFPLIGSAFLPAVPSWTYPVFFQAMGYNVRSILLIVLRQVVLLVPLAWILSFFGLHFVWLTYPLSELITTALGLYYYRQWKRQELPSC